MIKAITILIVKQVEDRYDKAAVANTIQVALHLTAIKIRAHGLIPLISF
jgi:hypothetical protein